jgi:hypothetical protein
MLRLRLATSDERAFATGFSAIAIKACSVMVLEIFMIAKLLRLLLNALSVIGCWVVFM